jgi:hypothetical protein
MEETEFGIPMKALLFGIYTRGAYQGAAGGFSITPYQNSRIIPE